MFGFGVFFGGRGGLQDPRRMEVERLHNRSRLTNFVPAFSMEKVVKMVLGGFLHFFF
jgi:hypothetical protein